MIEEMLKELLEEILLEKPLLQRGTPAPTPETPVEE